MKPETEPEVTAALRRMVDRPPLPMLILEALRDWGGSQGLSGRAVAGHVEVSPTTVIKCLHELADVGAVTQTRTGRTDLWVLTEPAAKYLTDREQT